MSIADRTPQPDRVHRSDRIRRPRPLRPQLIADGVVAGYIHEISARHREHGTGSVVSYRQRARSARGLGAAAAAPAAPAPPSLGSLAA